MVEDESGARLCLICSAISDSAHFGVDSCRACAAFFRRTVTLKKKYICRQSTQSCNVNKDVRFVCRRCRYQRCLDIGMHPGNVHSKLDRIKKEPETERAPQYVHSESDSIDSPRASPIERIRLSTTTGTPLLRTIEEQFKVLTLTSANSENIVMCEMTGEYVPQDLLSDRLFKATMNSLNQCAKATLNAHIDFAKRSFPKMSLLDGDEKWTLVKNFLTAKFIFLGVHRSLEIFPEPNKRVMVSFITYADMDNLDYYISDLPSGVKDKDRTTSLIRDLMQRSMLEWLGPMLQRAEITELEKYAILGLLFWPAYHLKATPKIVDMCHQYHQQIFSELQTYYREQLNLPDYSSRIANITSILLCIQGTIQRLKEDMEIYRLLNVYDGNELVYNVVQ